MTGREGANVPPAPKAAMGAVAGKGRGIFATAPIAAGEVIVEDPTVALDAAGCAAIEATPLADYYFWHPGDAEGGLVVLGLSSLCNHAEDPNADTCTHFDEALGWLVRLTARRSIALGEEVTRRYACALWFEST